MADWRIAGVLAWYISGEAALNIEECHCPSLTSQRQFLSALENMAPCYQRWCLEPGGLSMDALSLMDYPETYKSRLGQICD